MHRHDIETLRRRANQARELALMTAEPHIVNRLLGAAAGYEIEAERLEQDRDRSEAGGQISN
jgi:hypothetical protein